MGRDSEVASQLGLLADYRRTRCRAGITILHRSARTRCDAPPAMMCSRPGGAREELRRVGEDLDEGGEDTRATVHADTAAPTPQPLQALPPLKRYTLLPYTHLSPKP